jgi:hypothetical protein
MILIGPQIKHQKGVNNPPYFSVHLKIIFTTSLK